VTYLRLAFGIGLSLAAGYFVAAILLRQIHARAWLKQWLGLGTGLGFTSLFFFIWRLISGPEGRAYFLAELALVAGLAFIWLLSRRRIKEDATLGPPSDQAPLPDGWTWLLNLSLALAALLAGLTFIFGTLVFPHGGWDAWAIWNLAARYLFAGRTEWRLLFDPALFHSDYPMLLGSSVARLWTYRSTVDFIAPAVVAFLFSLATFGLLLTLANLTRGGVAGRLAGLALLGSSTILVIAPTQCADIPLGYYLLGALGCLSLHQKVPKSGLLVFAGVLLGIGAWTKNEGWLLIIAVLLGWTATRVIFDRSYFFTRACLQEAGWLLVGLIPVIVFPLIQKWYLAPPNDILAAQGAQTLTRMSDSTRWLEIGRRFAVMLFSLEPKYSAPLGLLVVLVAVFGIREKALSRPEIWTNLLTLGAAILGYFLVYLISPHNLNWHLSTSLFRLYGQLWPAAVFTLILLIRLPGETKSDMA
jgi:hypothetical protein